MEYPPFNRLILLDTVTLQPLLNRLILLDTVTLQPLLNRLILLDTVTLQPLLVLNHGLYKNMSAYWSNRLGAA